MKRLIIPTLFVFLLGSCSTKQNPLCECIQKSEALNALSNELLYSDTTTEQDLEKLIALRYSIDSICEPFKMMGPEELYKMRNECLDQEMLEVMEE